MTSLPAAPNLEQLRKQAKDLLRAARAGDPDAAARVAAHQPGAPAVPTLAAAQLAVARDYGFPSWPRLRAYVERAATHGPGLEHAYHDDIDYYADRAEGLRASARDGTPAALEAFTSIGAPLTLAGARRVLAHQHGLGSWAALQRHIAGLCDSGEPFARAYRAVEDRDLDALRAQLDRFGDLVAAHGTNGNDLLGMAGAKHDLRLTALLLERGADPASANAHGWTALHQAAYSDQPELARILLAAGAPVDASARGDGGTPLVVALFWGNTATAELLAEHGTPPGNLRVAAGLGRLEEIERLVGPDGRHAPEASAHREFYRPHSGFPAWRPSDDPREALDESLAWAARNDRCEALELLVARGAAVDADVYRGTALTWAAATGRVAAIRTLAALGADPDRRGTFGGPDHGEGATALHLAAGGGQLAAIEALLELGADPTAKDALHGSDPAGWAEHGGHREAAELIRSP